MNEEIEKLINTVNDCDNEMFELRKTIAVRIAVLEGGKSKAKEKLDEMIAKEAMKDLCEKEYGCGTATFETAEFKIKTVVSKKVKWDEDALWKIRDQIIDAGQDPKVFIKHKLSVTETAFKAFPDDIQETFLPARTVEPSAPKITIERKG